MKIEIQKLKEVADIILGYSFRGRIDFNDEGNIFVVGAKEIKDNFIISDKSNLNKIVHPIYENKLINKNDILLSNRGYFKAGVFSFEENTIASSSVYIIRIKNNIILSEYLAIWINSKKGQNQISKNVTGSMIKTILKSELENLKIDIPSLEKQNKIVELYKTQIELQNNLDKKKSIIENIFQGTLSTIINNKK